MIVCDTSVLVAAFARWHAHHDVARAAVARCDVLIDHVAVETFSVLTRLPPPQRVPPHLVTAFPGHHFPVSAPRLPGAPSARVVEAATAHGISGGAVYDLLVALSAEHGGARLLSLDRSAVPA